MRAVTLGLTLIGGLTIAVALPKVASAQYFEGAGGSHGEKASATIMLTPTWDGVADTVAIGGLV